MTFGSSQAVAPRAFRRLGALTASPVPRRTSVAGSGTGAGSYPITSRPVSSTPKFGCAPGVPNASCTCGVWGPVLNQSEKSPPASWLNWAKSVVPPSMEKKACVLILVSRVRAPCWSYRKRSSGNTGPVGPGPPLNYSVCFSAPTNYFGNIRHLAEPAVRFYSKFYLTTFTLEEITQYVKTVFGADRSKSEGISHWLYEKTLG